MVTRLIFAKNKMYKFFLTGGGGFLGNILYNYLQENNYEVYRPDLNTAGIKFDITKEVFIPNDFSFEIVLHAAGKAHVVPNNPQEEKAFYDVNFEGTKNLCSAIDRLIVKPKAFIFFSTVAVYGVESGDMITEDFPLAGESPYSKSKILAEHYLQEWSSSNNIKLGILRLPLVAGPNPPGNLATMINGIRSGRYLSIGDASARKSMVWAEDIASVIQRLAEVGGIYNITDGIHPSFKELEIVISKALNKGKPIALPLSLAKALSGIGDILGSRFPINGNKLEKITSTLTFDDSKARKMLIWKSSSVLERLSKTL